MSYAGTGAPPGTVTYVQQGDSAATIQAKIDSVQPGGSLVFESGTYDFGGATIVGKSGVTVWADGHVVIDNAPGAGSGGAFDFSGQSDWTIGGNAPGNGFVFNGSLVNATNASGGWIIGNCIFNNQQSNGFDGSAIRMNGASFGTIINNEFNGASGNVIGMYNLDHITIDGNYFLNCFQPISIQGPTTSDTAFGHDIVIERNVFLGTQRVAVEIGPATSGSEYFSGLIINDNYFDDFKNTVGEGTLLAISVVGQSSENTTITNNYIGRGPTNSGEVGVAIEMTGTGHVSGNTIVNFSYAVLTYQSGWNVYDNVVRNDGSSPYYGFANNGAGSGVFAASLETAGLPANRAIPSRVSWGAGSTAGDATWVVTGAADASTVGAVVWDQTGIPGESSGMAVLADGTSADPTVELVGVIPTVSL